MKHPVHDNYYALRAGTPYAATLANRGPEALQHLLVGDLALVAEQLRLLNRTELGGLALAAEHLARVARATVEEFWPGRSGVVVVMDVTPDPGLHAHEIEGLKGCPECAGRTESEGP